MKNLQPIIRFSIIVFFLFGIFQTAFGQTIDSMSKVILDKVEKEYASYETMQYEVIIMSEYDGQIESDTIEVGTTQTMLRIENEEGAAVSDGNRIISLEKFDNELDTIEYNEEIEIFWLNRIFDSFEQDGDISFVETKKDDGKTVHVLSMKIENEAAKYAEVPEYEEGMKNEDAEKIYDFYYFYIDTNTNQILKFTYKWDGDLESTTFHYSNFKANPTFPTDYFEIKE